MVPAITAKKRHIRFFQKAFCFLQAVPAVVITAVRDENDSAPFVHGVFRRRNREVDGIKYQGRRTVGRLDECIDPKLKCIAL